MPYELTGTLFEIYDTVQRSEKFSVREFIVESKEGRDHEFTNYVKFQATNQRTGVLNDMSIGDEVKVHFNIRGSKWEKDGKTSFFINLDAWKIDVLSKKEKKNFIQEAELVTPDDDLPF